MSLDTGFWISELGRLYMRSTEAINNEQSDAIEPLSEEFNETLIQLKEEFPDNPIVTGTASVEPYTEGTYERSGNAVAIAPSRRRDEALHEVRSRCERIANAIGYDLPEWGSEGDSSDNMIMVSVNSRQEATQEVHQQVTVESVQRMIQTLPRTSDQKEELQELLDEFESEINGEQDQTRLRQILAKANEISTEVAAQMAAVALTQGASSIFDFGSIL